MVLILSQLSQFKHVKIAFKSSRAKKRYGQSRLEYGMHFKVFRANTKENRSLSVKELEKLWQRML